MIGHLRASSRARRPLAGVMLAAAGLWLSACSEVETETAAGYEPATLESVKGRDDFKRVTRHRGGRQADRPEDREGRRAAMGARPSHTPR